VHTNKKISPCSRYQVTFFLLSKQTLLVSGTTSKDIEETFKVNKLDRRSKYMELI
jgi:hypothetical protein